MFCLKHWNVDIEDKNNSYKLDKGLLTVFSNGQLVYWIRRESYEKWVAERRNDRINNIFQRTLF